MLEGNMRIYGLTGGIASGKSTVAEHLRRCGVPLVDADAIYHGLIAPHSGAASPLALAVGQAFAGVLQPDGRLDRAQLAQRVFADPAAKARLEAITHPAVAHAAAHALQSLKTAGHAFAVYDVPLLFERGLADRFDDVVLVWVPEPVQLARLQTRDRLTPQQAHARLAAQWPLAQKRPHARWAIDNSGTRESTYEQTEALVVLWRQNEARPSPR